MFYCIAKEDLTHGQLHVYRVPPKQLMAPQGPGRYTIVGFEAHADVCIRYISDNVLFAYARGQSDTPPSQLRHSSWHIIIVFRRAKGTKGKRQHIILTYVAENGGVFSIAENDEYAYLDGDFADEHEAERQRGRILHEAATRYLSFSDRSLEDLIPQLRSEFAYLAKTSP
jgi:hypothetical protein